MIARRADRILEIRNGLIVATRAGMECALQSGPSNHGPWCEIGISPLRFRLPHRPLRRSRLPPASVLVLEPGCSRFPPGWCRRSSWLSRLQSRSCPLPASSRTPSAGQARAALEDAALLWLRVEIEDIAYNGGVSYAIDPFLGEPLDRQAAVFALSPTLPPTCRSG